MFWSTRHIALFLVLPRLLLVLLAPKFLGPEQQVWGAVHGGEREALPQGSSEHLLLGEE